MLIFCPHSRSREFPIQYLTGKSSCIPSQEAIDQFRKQRIRTLKSEDPDFYDSFDDEEAPAEQQSPRDAAGSIGALRTKITKEQCPVRVTARFGEVFQYGDKPSEYTWDAPVKHVIVWDEDTDSIEDYETKRIRDIPADSKVAIVKSINGDAGGEFESNVFRNMLKGKGTKYGFPITMYTGQIGPECHLFPLLLSLIIQLWDNIILPQPTTFISIRNAPFS
eukprot:SAG31_NODE_76_length_27534_cov_13.661868_1_plen_221_part_00